MKLKYGIAKMEIVPFAAEDVIAASLMDPTIPSTEATEPTSGLTNGGTGSGGSADFSDMFPGLSGSNAT